MPIYVSKGGGGGGADADAIHDNVAGEIAAVAAKGAPDGNDLVLIEDSADANNKKRVTISTMPATDPYAIHDNVAGEINAIAEKTAPVAADMILIEDSVAANAKKKVQITNLPQLVPTCMVHISSPVSIANASTTYLNFDTEDWDDDGMHEGVTNPDRVTIQEAGKYVIIADGYWASNSTGDRKLTLVSSAGTSYGDIRGANVESSASVVGMSSYSAADYIRVAVYQGSGGALNLSGAWVAVFKVRE